MEMAFRAAATARPPPSSSTCLPYAPPRASSLPKPTTKPAHHQFRPISLSIPTSTALSLVTLFTSPNDANAFSFSKDQIMTSLTQVESAVDQVEEVGSGVLDFSQRVLQVVIDGLKPTFDLALPILQKTGDQALKIASPVISEASKKAQETLQSSGIDTEPVLLLSQTVVGAAQQTTKVIEDAKPIAASTVETIASADPVVIVGTAGALFVAYLLLPPIRSGISYSLRGYKGNLTPAQTLDLISTQNYLMIDVRSEKDKNKFGIPRLPSSAKNKMISIPLEELPSKIKGIVRNTKKVEAEIAALKISNLKRINKGSNIVIMDSYSDTAKIIARALTSLGFKNCWIMADGFAGGKGWLQSRLGTDSLNVSIAEVLSPSRVIPSAVRRIGTTSSTSLRSNQKFLSGSTE
ncbi:Rhodanese-like domain [Macleaya cordata]|uniref:Rhodanese-like domain n=1 Tax=Macleaya cordata TaxID=56857 RepID=A0A200Q7I8_MACCD|nr:Rhodanese-like domain [Macleaya cordata]